MWRPLHLDYILDQYEPLDRRVLLSLFTWIILIAGAIWISLYTLPEDWVRLDSNKNQLIKIFLLNPPMLLGLLLLFWFGFEWSFIPVFLSMFIIGLFSHLDPLWSILFGLSFVFALAIYAIVYHCIFVNYQLRSLASILVFVGTSFVASTASSLGAFIWSLSHNLSAAETASLWNGWWAGTFLQAVVVGGIFIFALSPKVEAFKDRWFDIPKREDVSTKWVYSAVLLVTIVISVFIYSGDHLGKTRIAEEVSKMEIFSKEAIESSLGSYEIITWVSIWIVFCVGLGAVFLIGSWNDELKRKVEERTISLEQAEQEIKNSLHEKEVLLQEIHHRVKNNLAVVTALLDLQYMRLEGEEVKHILSDAKSRVKSMSYVHETLYQTENFSRVDMHDYMERLCKSITTTFRPMGKVITLDIQAKECELNMERAIPLGLLINELLVNAFKHAFCDRDQGSIKVELTKEGDSVNLLVEDDGVGFKSTNGSIDEGQGLGMTLIKTLSKQLRADLDLKSEPGSTRFSLKMSA